jgi:hypothetical protein
MAALHGNDVNRVVHSRMTKNGIEYFLISFHIPNNSYSFIISFYSISVAFLSQPQAKDNYFQRFSNGAGGGI